jgi:hypothetical protein
MFGRLYEKLYVNRDFICIFKVVESGICDSEHAFCCVEYVAGGQSNVQFPIFKGQMSSAFVGHLTPNDEVALWSQNTGQPTPSHRVQYLRRMKL